MGMRFYLGAMKMFWNQIEVKDVQHNVRETTELYT